MPACPIVQRVALRRARDRRRFPRFRLPAGRGSVGFSFAGLPGEESGFLQARVKDLSRGGIGVLTTSEIPRFHPVRGELAVPAIPVPIPVLLQARWIKSVKTAKKTSTGHRYQIGLKFLV